MFRGSSASSPRVWACALPWLGALLGLAAASYGTATDPRLLSSTATASSTLSGSSPADSIAAGLTQACDNPVTGHGDSCSELFLFDEQEGSPGYGTFAVRWATSKKQPNAWRFSWRPCLDPDDCSGPYSTSTHFNRNRDQACGNGAKAHFDHYVDGFNFPANSYMEIGVQYQCDNGVWSERVSDVYSYGNPLALEVSNVSAARATLSWQPTAGAIGYIVRYGLPDQETPLEVSAGADVESVTLDGLAANTLYEAQVVARMPGGTSLPAQKEFITSSGTCAYTATATGTAIGSGGGSGSIAITAAAGCPWTAVSDSWWLTVTAGASGSGAAPWSAVANTTPDLRTGIVTVAGQRIVVSQAGNVAAHPAPAITSLAPNSVYENTTRLELTVNGSGFIDGSRVRVNGSSRVTTFHGAGLLTANLVGADLQHSGTLAITVFTPTPGGGASNPASLTVISATGCVRSAPAVTLSPAGQSGYRGQPLTYRVTLTNHDNPQCPATTFSVAPTLPAAGWIHTPSSLNLTVAPGQSAFRDVVVSSSATAPHAPHILRETATSWEGHAASGQATYTVYSLVPPDTCGRAQPTLLVSPAEQLGSRGQQLPYRVTVTNNDNPQCGVSTFSVTPTLPAAGWGHSPASFTLTLLPGETGWRDVLVSSAGSSPFIAHAFTESATSPVDHAATGQAFYTVYDLNPPDTCGRGNPTVTVAPFYQTGTQAQSLDYTVTVTNNDADTCPASAFTVTPTLPTVAAGRAWSHTPQYDFTLFAAPGQSASRTIRVTSASLAPFEEHTIVWTATHTSSNEGAGQTTWNVVPYGAVP